MSTVSERRAARLAAAIAAETKAKADAKKIYGSEGIPYDLDSIELEDEIDQAACDVIVRLTAPDLLIVLHRRIDRDIAFMGEAAIADWWPAEDEANKDRSKVLKPLFGRSINSVRAAANKVVTSFKPDSGDGTWQAMRNGKYERTAESVTSYVVRDPEPVIGYTLVKPEVVPMARLVMCSTEEVEKKEVSGGKALVRTTELVKANKARAFGLTDLEMTIGQNLTQTRADGRMFWLWDLCAAALTKEAVSITGLNHLFWAYRAPKFKVTPDENGANENFADILERAKKFSVPRESLKGFNNHMVWHFGSPVGPQQIIASYLEINYPAQSMAGNFSSKLIPWLSNRTLYMPSIRAADPKAKLEVKFVESDVVHKQKADIYWAPAKEHFQFITAHTIVLPITTPVNTTALAELWMKPEKAYGVSVTYGSMPLVWITEAKIGLTRALAAAYCLQLCYSTTWMGVHNLSRCFAHELDIFAVGIAADIQIYTVEKLTAFKYCPMQKRAKLLNTLTWDKEEVSYKGAVFVGKQAEDPKDVEMGIGIPILNMPVRAPDDPRYPQPARKAMATGRNRPGAVVADPVEDGEVLDPAFDPRMNDA